MSSSIFGFQSSYKKILWHWSEFLCVRNFLLIDNPWAKCMVRQRLMGWSRKNAGWRKRAIESDEFCPAVCQGRRFLELLLIWSQSGCHPGELSVIYDNSRDQLAHHQVEESLHQATAQLTGGNEVREFRWLQPTPLITLVLSNPVCVLYCSSVKQIHVPLVWECLCTQVWVDNNILFYSIFSELLLHSSKKKKNIKIVWLIHWLWYIAKYALNYCWIDIPQESLTCL